MESEVNESVNLSFLVPDGNTTLYVRVKVYAADGATQTLDLTHVENGLYWVFWTPTAEGIYQAVFTAYVDSNHTIPAPYDRGAETWRITSVKESISRLLGLTHQNTVIDQQIYNGNGRMTSARIRTFSSAAAAQAAFSGASSAGLLFEYRVESAYENEVDLSRYSLVKVT